ncbi:hypothetical protein [uncultured Roseobacter sp.]|uniref:hypothetical protein n=1 Tax=uncultured Roseobacter sp. TaxID=114847 RepID=UPI002635B078|nr:hypothetical protein [uncultured Roseobacter sp.]
MVALQLDLRSQIRVFAIIHGLSGFWHGFATRLTLMTLLGGQEIAFTHCAVSVEHQVDFDLYVIV